MAKYLCWAATNESCSLWEILVMFGDNTIKKRTLKLTVYACPPPTKCNIVFISGWRHSQTPVSARSICHRDRR